MCSSPRASDRWKELGDFLRGGCVRYTRRCAVDLPGPSGRNKNEIDAFTHGPITGSPTSVGQLNTSTEASSRKYLCIALPADSLRVSIDPATSATRVTIGRTLSWPISNNSSSGTISTRTTAPGYVQNLQHRGQIDAQWASCLLFSCVQLDHAADKRKSVRAWLVTTRTSR